MTMRETRSRSRTGLTPRAGHSNDQDTLPASGQAKRYGHNPG